MGAGASLDIGLGNMVMMSQGPQLYCYGCQTLGQYSSQREDMRSGLCPHCGCSFVELVDLNRPPRTQNNFDSSTEVTTQQTDINSSTNPENSSNSIVSRMNSNLDANLPVELRERRMINATALMRLLALQLALSDINDNSYSSSTELVIGDNNNTEENDNCLKSLNPLHLSILLTNKKSFSQKKFETQPLCPICNENFTKNEEDLIQLPRCSHLFHWNCIDIWLKKKPNCPICRLDVFHCKSKLFETPKPGNLKELTDADCSNQNDNKDSSSSLTETDTDTHTKTEESSTINDTKSDENISTSDDVIDLTNERSMVLFSNGSVVESSQEEVPFLKVPSQAELGLLSADEIRRLLSFYTFSPPEVSKIESDPLFK